MKVLLTAINSKYIHSNLAVRYIKTYGKAHHDLNFDIAEFTINQRLDYILRKIAKQKPDVLAISCYIWNIDMALSLACEVKKILPYCKVILGGPEVSFNSKEIMRDNRFVNFIISGEGEKAFSELILAIRDNLSLTDVPNLTYQKDGEVLENPSAPLLSLDDVPFPYEDLSALSNQILYYETSRGCPFACKYCLSSVTRSVRFLSKERWSADLQKFLDARVRQVKFVDRTFNINREHTLAIFEYLKTHDNGVTNFHFEISAHLIDDEVLNCIKDVREGLFQFEIGVQSTNPKTIEEINRNTDFDKLSQAVTKINSNHNIHQHLDLIAGLPFEDYNSFKKSFNDVYALCPHQLQLGFLKVLKGSPMCDEAEKYGITYRSYPPYEVLSTNWISFDEICQFKNIEEMVEVYQNSFRFSKSIGHLVALFPSPFDFFESLGDFYEKGGYADRSLSKLDYYNMLFDFAKFKNLETDKLPHLFLLDIYAWEKANKLPSCTSDELTKRYRDKILEFYENPANLEKYLPEYAGDEPKHILRTAHIIVVPFDEDGNAIDTAYLMNYKQRDITGRATIYKIEL